MIGELYALLHKIESRKNMGAGDRVAQAALEAYYFEAEQLLSDVLAYWYAHQMLPLDADTLLRVRGIVAAAEVPEVVYTRYINANN
jgi:hypothetical protein